MEKDWKLNLRYGKLTTPFKHYTLLAQGLVGELVEGFECRPGTAIIAMKIWALDANQAADVFQSIGGQIGYRVTHDIEVYETDPVKPPEDNPYGYDIQFTPF
ncbi:hypothetical protein [Aridibaculum aurantiacum]|uniref:hypothetical protein n=1 Tax=Aridibaculum aurantiacum TaxID=2810307 RepID=UPI001A958DEA|nr:hypothetical protein [Aridibaculum aurantiacum]